MYFYLHCLGLTLGSYAANHKQTTAAKSRPGLGHCLGQIRIVFVYDIYLCMHTMHSCPAIVLQENLLGINFPADLLGDAAAKTKDSGNKLASLFFCSLPAAAAQRM